MKIVHEVGAKVFIIPLDYEGRVKSIWISMLGVQYEVRYFHNGQENVVYFWGDELESMGGDK